MEVGKFGNMVFSVSRKKINSFQNFSKDVSAEWKEHSTYKNKPTSEFTGANLQQITFDIHLSAALGINPLKEIIKWEKICEQGKHDTLFIGKKQVGKYDWKVEKVSESWNHIFKNGGLIAADITVTMSEYVTKNTVSAYNISKTSKSKKKKSLSNKSVNSIAIGGTYTIKTQLVGYYTSLEAKNQKATNRTGKVYPGKYYIYNKANGMVNVTKVKGSPGSWINPTKNK